MDFKKKKQKQSASNRTRPKKSKGEERAHKRRNKGRRRASCKRRRRRSGWKVMGMIVLKMRAAVSSERGPVDVCREEVSVKLMRLSISATF